MFLYSADKYSVSSKNSKMNEIPSTNKLVIGAAEKTEIDNHVILLSYKPLKSEDSEILSFLTTFGI